ncbi:TetR/AcrR family transcriptional regulator [Duganella callida]|uniref:TetR/AcrR family transcriptional regulator n=1 Tax=Duganella callida TaxID=2561932 RepID=A0A4Y9SQD3_9BURK|nr:TetR/AcrR family transcriptional regulator [Duganella callida]TFW28870.1 TetR/AcrR family transcriptional regulator [Duganella callida]
MIKNTRRVQRGEASLSRERIIEAAIALLDGAGESGLTFRALAERLATGAGAIYYHVDNKTDLLNAAADAIVAAVLPAPAAPATGDAPVVTAPDASVAAAADASPQTAVRAIALAVFDAIDGHPWLGSALMQAPSALPMVRILESLGQQIRALGVAESAQWQAVSALLHYIIGVAGQNAANAQTARARNAVRDDFLGAVADGWAQLDAVHFPFTRGIAARLRVHDDRADFLAGVDYILTGVSTAGL